MNFSVILYLLLNIITASLIFIVFKIGNVKKANPYHLLLINYLVAFIFPVCSIDWGVGLTLSSASGLKSLWIAIVIGVFFVVNFIMVSESTKRVGVGLTTAFSKMSVVIPVAVGMIFLGQTSSLVIKIIGLVLTILSFYLILYGKGENNKKLSLVAILLPLFVFITSGLNDMLQELGRKFVIITDNDSQIFMFYIFLSASIFTLLCTIVDYIKNRENIKWVSIILGLILGLTNYYTVKLLLINVHNLGGTLVFPILNTSVVIFTTFVGVFFFKEKLTKRQWVGLAVAISAVVLIAVAI